MSHSHQFPPLKESDVRRLGSTTAFQKGLRLWDDGSVHNPMVSLQDAVIFADVLDGPQQHFKVMAQHRAGDEFTAACDCGQNAVCSHVVAALLAWAHEGYGFAQVAQPSAEVAPEGVQQRWREYLQHANMQHLRAIARRHQFKLKG